MFLEVRIHPASPYGEFGQGDLGAGGRADWVLSTPQAGQFGGPHQLRHPWAAGQDEAVELMQILGEDEPAAW